MVRLSSIATAVNLLLRCSWSLLGEVVWVSLLLRVHQRVRGMRPGQILIMQRQGLVLHNFDTAAHSRKDTAAVRENACFVKFHCERILHTTSTSLVGRFELQLGRLNVDVVEADDVRSRA